MLYTVDTVDNGQRTSHGWLNTIWQYTALSNTAQQFKFNQQNLEKFRTYRLSMSAICYV
ncbi:hypothetical protein DPMN_008026 [Dreissena polymorpha]|uniref:Uncharacterized protein n=1 Tax=Dreissena polymorpha TaxID=45954 RepID=A0A9D4RYS2_DREPO|nr:hypothetical protein DPMN_008026 [Dreissena polymorpha]